MNIRNISIILVFFNTFTNYVLTQNKTLSSCSYQTEYFDSLFRNCNQEAACYSRQIGYYKNKNVTLGSEVIYNLCLSTKPANQGSPDSLIVLNGKYCFCDKYQHLFVEYYFSHGYSQKLIIKSYDDNGKVNVVELMDWSKKYQNQENSCHCEYYEYQEEGLNLVWSAYWGFDGKKWRFIDLKDWPKNKEQILYTDGSKDIK